MSSISRDKLRKCLQETIATCVGSFSRQVCLLLLLLVTFSSLSVSAQNATADEINDQELVTVKEVEALRKAAPSFYKALNRSSALNQAETDAIKNQIRVQVLQLTLKSERRNLPVLRKKIKQHFVRAKQPAIDLMLSEITAQCMKLLKHPVPVRLNAVMLISDLNQVRATKEPAIPYLGKTDELIAIVDDPNQHQGVKVIAVNGLIRLCKNASVKISLRKKMTRSFIRELNSADSEIWYKRVCVIALGTVDDLYDAQRKPYIIQTLSEILVDNKQAWQVRAAAAHSLGRAKVDAQINVPLLNYEIARFTYEAGVQYNQRPKSAHWKLCFFYVYTAYHQITLTDTGLLKQAQNGSLSKHKTVIEAAYKNILPVVNGVTGNMSGSRISNKSLEDLKSFIAANVPKNFTVGPNSKPLRQAAVPENKNN